MTRLRLLRAVLIGAALLAPPAMARESGVPLNIAGNANACATIGTRHADAQSCDRNRASNLRGAGERDVWGHWGSYYGPMIHAR
jgi:hypothetical protein